MTSDFWQYLMVYTGAKANLISVALLGKTEVKTGRGQKESTSVREILLSFIITVQRKHSSLNTSYHLNYFCFETGYNSQEKVE
jgi:hypothetical protein